MHTTDLQQIELFQKPVSTLAIIPKTGAITRVGRQAYTIMMLMAREQESDSEGRYAAPVSAIIKGFDGSEGTRDELKRHLRSMVTNAIEWQSPTTDESSSWVACPLLAEVHLTKRNNENWVSWAYPPTLKSELLSPERYAQLQRSTISRFRTYAGLALYEICARYRTNPSKLTPKQPWRWWVPVLTGKPTAQTQKIEFRFFNRDTLKPAVIEVNEFSELKIAIKEIKTGRSVEQLQFSVELKKYEEISESGQPPNIANLVSAVQLGVDRDVAEDLCVTYSELEFALGVNRLREQIQRGGAIASKSAYLKKILANAMKSRVTEPVRPSENVRAAQATQAETRGQGGGAGQGGETVGPRSVKSGSQIQNEQISPIETEESRRARIVQEELFAMDESTLKALLQDLRQDMQLRAVPKLTIQRLEAGKWQSALVLGELIRFYWRKTRETEWTQI